MKKEEKHASLLEYETYIYIDVSNIRSACLKTLGFKIDFDKLLVYFKKKYPMLREVRYYEGVSNDDFEKKFRFEHLEKEGYIVKALERKGYVNPAVYKKVKCRKCGYEWRTVTQKRTKTLKSNVDVFLATEFLSRAFHSHMPVHLILVSCDGDYAEMIRGTLESNANIVVSVLGTPVVKNNRNTFSMRLQSLRGRLEKFIVLNIESIKDLIS